MADPEAVINPLHPTVVDRLTDVFKDIHLQYQTGKLRADQVSIATYRADPATYDFPTQHVAGPSPEVASNAIHKVPVSDPDGEIDVQVYVPTAEAVVRGGLASPDGRLPLYIDLHGGGFVIGSLAADDSLCRQFAQDVGCVVFNVDYRLAPEYPHPVTATDCWAVLKWAVAHADELRIDPTRIAVGGLSAGGCLAAVLALLARDDPEVPDLVLQVLIVPVIDARFVPAEGHPDPATVPYASYFDCEYAPMLPLARLVWFYNLWLGSGAEREARANDFRASPILAKSHANLPPASFHVAEIDPLRSEAEAYHEKLTAAGTPSSLKIYKGVGHTVTHWNGKLPEGRQVMFDVTEALRKAFTRR